MLSQERGRIHLHLHTPLTIQHLNHGHTHVAWSSRARKAARTSLERIPVGF